MMIDLLGEEEVQWQEGCVYRGQVLNHVRVAHADFMSGCSLGSEWKNKLDHLGARVRTGIQIYHSWGIMASLVRASGACRRGHRHASGQSPDTRGSPLISFLAFLCASTHIRCPRLFSVITVVVAVLLLLLLLVDVDVVVVVVVPFAPSVTRRVRLGNAIRDT
jgi:hypothetical protein